MCHERSARHGRKGGENKQDADNKGDELPELFINETNLPATAKELARLIAGLRDFVFNGTIPARIAIDDDCMPRAVETAPESVCVHGHEVCRPMRLKREKGRPKKAEVKMAEPAQKLVPCTLPMSVARLYLYGLHGQWGLKTLHGITTAPILEDNGNIRIAEGFDDNTGLYCYKIPAVTVPSNPTKDEATAALYRLRYFFRTFPYTDAERLLDPDLGVEIVDLRKAPGMDESTSLVAVMTAVCRQSLVLTPGYLVRAAAMSGAGTGKGLLVAAICILSSGAAPTAFTAGHDKEEFDKRLSSALIEQRPCVFLDNYNNAELHSAILASALTQSPAMVRRMGQSSMTPLYTRTFIVVTGNGVTVAEDQVRRWLITEFDARTENPENRKFDPGFLDTVRGARTDLLTDALTIWRWGRQNNIAQGKPLGSYEVWSQWCRDPILALGGRDPVDRNAETKAADPLRQRMIDIFEAWWAHHGDILIKANDLHADVLGLIDFKAKSNDIGELTVNRQWVAGYLRSKIGARVGGFLLSQVKDTSRTRPVAFYKLQQTKEPIP